MFECPFKPVAGIAVHFHWAVINGDRRPASIMGLDAGMDADDVALQKRTEIGANETAGELQTASRSSVLMPSRAYSDSS